MTDIQEYWNDEKIVKRFFDKVDKKSEEECWEWTAGRNPKGYGGFYINRVRKGAHRVSFELANKRLITEELKILHRCDNPKCVNPLHLSEGTQQDNMIDKVNKNRQAKGEKHGCSKLTKEQVLEIRKKYSTSNYSYRQLGKEYNCDHSIIGDIINKKIWKHI